MTEKNVTPAELDLMMQELATETGAFLTYLLTELDPATTGAVCTGRFAAEHVVNDTVGYRSDDLKAHVVYGDFYPNGNIEGSFYVHFGAGDGTAPYGHSLRLRWADKQFLHLDGGGNDVALTIERSDDGIHQVTLQPRRVAGHRILALDDEAGVRTEHPDAWEKIAYDKAVAGGYSDGMEDPGDTPDVIIPRVKVLEMFEGMREGIRVGRAAVGELASRQPA